MGLFSKKARASEQRQIVAPPFDNREWARLLKVVSHQATARIRRLEQVVTNATNDTVRVLRNGPDTTVAERKVAPTIIASRQIAALSALQSATSALQQLAPVLSPMSSLDAFSPVVQRHLSTLSVAAMKPPLLPDVAHLAGLVSSHFSDAAVKDLRERVHPDPNVVRAREASDPDKNEIHQALRVVMRDYGIPDPHDAQQASEGYRSASPAPDVTRITGAQAGYGVIGAGDVHRPSESPSNTTDATRYTDANQEFTTEKSLDAVRQTAVVHSRGGLGYLEEEIPARQPMPLSDVKRVEAPEPVLGDGNFSHTVKRQTAPSGAASALGATATWAQASSSSRPVVQGQDTRHLYDGVASPQPAVYALPGQQGYPNNVDTSGPYPVQQQPAGYSNPYTQPAQQATQEESAKVTSSPQAAGMGVSKGGAITTNYLPGTTYHPVSGRQELAERGRVSEEHASVHPIKPGRGKGSSVRTAYQYQNAPPVSPYSGAVFVDDDRTLLLRYRELMSL